MFGESSLSISYLFLFSAVGLAEILLTQGHVKGSRQYQASPAHFLWLLQQPLGASVVLEGLAGLDCPVPDELDPPLPLLALPLCVLLGPLGLTAAT